MWYGVRGGCDVRVRGVNVMGYGVRGGCDVRVRGVWCGTVL